MAKKTVKELEEQALKAEQKAKRLRAQARKMTKAEEARIDAEIIKSLRVWHASLPDDRRVAWSELPEFFMDQAEKKQEI